MSHTTTLAEDTAGTVATEDLMVEFRALGLAGCIDRLTAPLRRHSVLVRWETPHHGIEIPPASAVLLYRAAQESLSNVLRHSDATEVTVRLAAVFHGVRLTVTDNGVGYNPKEQAPRSRIHGYGVRLMTMAVHEAQGAISIDSVSGRGTRVSITLPLD